MTDSFALRLRRAVSDAESPLCVGLDPDPERLPGLLTPREPLQEETGDLWAEAFVRFCITIIEATAPVAAAYKPNLAFFEALGVPGWAALDAVCAHVRDTGRLLVLDGKRADIGNTARRYAASLYDGLGGDACTISPYMGHDGITPFLNHVGRCAFVLVATSNPGGADLQQRIIEGKALMHHVARMSAKAAEGQVGEIGFVVGATRPELLGAIRSAHPDVPLLVPGVGAQGGSVPDVMAANAGGPVLVNSSRSILYASSEEDFPDAARTAAERLAAALTR